MKEQAFRDANEIPLRPTNTRLLAGFVFCVATVCITGFVLLYLASDGFTRGTVSDLNSYERIAINEMQNDGILVRDATLPCTMQPHVVLKVKWNPQIRRYCVSSIGLRNIEIEALLPYLDRFAGLRNIDAPYLPTDEVTRIEKLVPSLAVTHTGNK